MYIFFNKVNFILSKNNSTSNNRYNKTMFKTIMPNKSLIINKIIYSKSIKKKINNNIKILLKNKILEKIKNLLQGKSIKIKYLDQSLTSMNL
jgi:hypothetical protein